MARFGLVGWGWRAQFFARAGHELGERARLCGVVTSDVTRAREVSDSWHVPAYPSLDDLLGAQRLDFVVVSVPAAAAPAVLGALAAVNMPALCETPPAPELDGLRALCDLARHGARLQVAEQYPFEPLHAARIALCRAGAIGQVSMASVSFSHGYHAFAVMRQLLGASGCDATIRAARRAAATENGNTRAGPRRQAHLLEQSRTVAVVELGEGLGLYDFEDNQHRSYVRMPHVAVRGARGEIADDRLRLVHGLDESVTIRLERVVAGEGGDLTGHGILGITGPSGWAWRNPFPDARLADDELAVARCLDLMAEHAGGAPGFYGVADGAQDHYLYLCLQRAAESGEVVSAEVQPWADQLQR
ncbi:MAG TPA: Gfo/Idh/MocA family oxidoreductase [Acidimicrobiales bacterium]|nr:Gfo/Idh/MocA family oxidoreductase [Acidimicrobiales bacterium]